MQSGLTASNCLANLRRGRIEKTLALFRGRFDRLELWRQFETGCPVPVACFIFFPLLPFHTLPYYYSFVVRVTCACVYLKVWFQNRIWSAFSCNWQVIYNVLLCLVHVAAEPYQCDRCVCVCMHAVVVPELYFDMFFIEQAGVHVMYVLSSVVLEPYFGNLCSS